MEGSNKVLKYNRGFHFDIGLVIFLIIIIYVIYSIFSYITSSPVAVYEVQQGTIATNNTYHGMILRDETIEYANQAGNINYYLKSGDKAAVRDIICSIDTVGTLSNKINSVISDGASLDEAMIGMTIADIDGYINSYNPSNMSSTYSFKKQLSSKLNQNLSSKALKTLNSEVLNAEANNTFFPIKTNTTGVISYVIDGYETIDVSNFTDDDFAGKNLKEVNLEHADSVKVLDPIYKRINSEKWNIVIEISNVLAESLKDSDYVKIRFCKDDYSTNAACTVIKRGGKYYLYLDLKTAMVRYLDMRFVDIELVINAKSGLKIPNSSITSKEFFVIPKEYFSVGGDSNSPGLLVQGVEDASQVNLIVPTIYYETDDAYYIDDDMVNSGDKIVKSDSKALYVVGTDVGSLEGVYNVNKGYAIFKQINVISANDEYSIVETKTQYGLSLYDHIALDGSGVKENQTIVK